MKRVSLFMPVALVTLAALGGCSRSNSYRKDQEFNRGDGSYYDKQDPKGATKRVEGSLQPKKRVSILRFWNDTPVKSGEIGEFAANELRRNLFATRRVILADQAGSSLNTEDYIQGDRVKVAQLIREGRRLGVGILVIGRVTKVVFRQSGDEIGILRQKQSHAAIDIEAKVFDISAGREILAVGKSAEAASSALEAVDNSNLDSPIFRAELIKLATRNAMALLVPDVIRAIEKMSWEGRVAKITGTRVYINAGRASGLVNGDILKILSQGDDIYDPVTGAYLGRAKGQLKGTVEVLEFIGPDGCVSELHTGGSFQEGDVVQLY